MSNKKLILNKSTVKKLKLQTDLQTGFPGASQDDSCAITQYCGNRSIK